MSLAFGKHQLSIPGPSVMPDRVLNAMHRAAPNIYGGEIVELTHEVKQELKALANCSGDVAIYIGNGHAVWEASLCNVFSRGDKALGLVTGRFGANWVTTAQALGVDVTPLEFTYGQPVEIPKMLRSENRPLPSRAMPVCRSRSLRASKDRPWFCVKGRIATAAGGPPLMQVLDWLSPRSANPAVDKTPVCW